MLGSKYLSKYCVLMLKFTYLVVNTNDMQDVFDKIISYHDLINGALVPDKLNAAAIANYLDSEHLPCKDMIIGKFKGPKLIDIFKITSANPLANNYYSLNKTIPHNLYFQMKYEQLINQLEHTKFDKLILNSAPYFTIPVSMPVASDWSKIEGDRLKYCYINQLLKNMEVEHINEIRSISLINDDELSKIKIAKLHRLLNSFLIELSNKFHLKPSDLKLKIKKEYSIRDCAILVYLSIVKVIDFTYKSFKRYMDFNLNIPFSSKLINNNNFIFKANQLEKRLNKIELDDNLQSILNDELEKIIKFQSLKSITFKEYDYYTILFKSMTRFFLKRENIELDQEKIVDFLIFINFKNESFFEYTINLIISTANDFEEVIDKYDYLVRKQKEYTQLDIKVSFYSVVEEHHLIRNLLKWINIEISHIKPVSTPINNNNIEYKEEFEKLISNLPLNVIAVLYRLFYDCETIGTEKKIEIAKWIQNTHTNNNNRKFSLDSIINKMSNPTSPYIKKAQEILLEMYEKSKLL